MRLSPVRCALALTVTLVTVAASVDAVADPADPAPSGPPVVLVAEVAAGTSLTGVADRADSGDADVRHVISPLRRIAVEVPANDVRAEAERLADLGGVVSVTTSARRYVSGTPNDPLYARRQRAYLSAVDLPRAWDVTHGSGGVKIAIVDTGADVGHPDLAGKIAKTYNAATGGTSVTDRVGHGTFVAGVAAAATNNRVGVAGAGFASRLLIAKVDRPANGSYDITTVDEAAGIVWAAKQGARVINISLGAPGSDPTERAAVQYAQRRGALVVAAAGNESTSVPSYPAAYSGVVGVGATDTTGRRAFFSNYGSWVDVAAPGTNITSTTPRAGSQFWGRTPYSTSQGTSFSSPLVAGVAALIAGRYPYASATQLANALRSSAKSPPLLDQAARMIQARAALNAIDGAQPPSLSRTSGVSAFYPVRDGYLDSFTPTAVLNRPATLTLRVRNAAGSLVRSLSAGRPAGRQGVSWAGTDASGRRLAAGRYDYQYVAVDGRGRRASTPWYGVTLSSKRLAARAVTLVRSGRTAAVTRDATSCERTTASSLAKGKRLVNACVGRTRTITATYAFTVPSAAVYASLTPSVRGRSASQPARIAGRVVRTTGGSTTTATLTVRSASTRTYPLGKATASRHVSSARTVKIAVALSNRYASRDDLSDFDISRVTLRVVYRVLV